MKTKKTLLAAVLIAAIAAAVLYLNPFTHIVSAYRDFFMYHTLPAMSSVLYMVVMAIICFVLGMFIFRKLEKGFAEEI